MIDIMSPPLPVLLKSLGGAERRLTDGAVLFHRDDPVERLFLVQEGSVELVRVQSDGTSIVLQRAGRNAVLAEASVFSERYHCDAVAARASTLLAVPMGSVRARLAGSPDFAEAWARHLAGEVQKARLRSEILSLRTVAERLEAWLSAEETGLPPRGEWKSLAHRLAVSPEALYRELARRTRRSTEAAQGGKRGR